MRAYLDHNATTPLSATARAAMVDALDVIGNPSSVHGAGRAARKVVEDTRALLAEVCGARVQDVIFTSGATEANAMMLAHAHRSGWDIAVSAGEHLSILEAAFDAEALHLRDTGLLDMEPALEALRRMDVPFLVSVHAANNETGVIQPIGAIAREIHEMGGLLHVDAVQALGKIDFHAATDGADYITVSAHKAGGPKGCGALVRTNADAPDLSAMLVGGGQERRLRGGTENLTGIAGFGGALRDLGSRLLDQGRIETLRDRIEAFVLEETPRAIMFGHGVARLPNTSAIALSGLSAETAVIRFDLSGVAIGSGSACSSGKVAASHVLKAMGTGNELARSAIRISLGPETTETDADAFCTVWREIAAGQSARAA